MAVDHRPCQRRHDAASGLENQGFAAQTGIWAVASMRREGTSTPSCTWAYEEPPTGRRRAAMWADGVAGPRPEVPCLL